MESTRIHRQCKTTVGQTEKRPSVYDGSTEKKASKGKEEELNIVHFENLKNRLCPIFYSEDRKIV